MRAVRPIVAAARRWNRSLLLSNPRWRPHKTLRVEFDTRQVFRNLKTAQEALDEWVSFYNTQRRHQAIADATRESRFRAAESSLNRRPTPRPERSGEQ